MVNGYTASQKKGKRRMTKTPPARDGMKAPQLTLKEKRAAKRAKQEPEAFIKARKGARG